MKLPALMLSVALLAFTAAAKADDDISFLRALEERDPARKSEALLTLAERGGRSTADLALIHLTRTPLPPKSLPRLEKLARARSGELIPTVLLVRAFRAEDSELLPEPMPRPEVFRLAYAGWKNAAARKLPPFEARLCRKLAGEVLKLAGECGESARLFPEIEKQLTDREELQNKFPLAELMEFCYRYAFTAEGFELYSPEWLESASPGRRIFATLLEESTNIPMTDDDEAAARIAFLRSIDDYDKAILLAANHAEKHPDPEGIGPNVYQVIDTVIGSGRDGIDELLMILKLPPNPGLKALTLVNGGKFREALELLPRISNAATRARVELACKLALGEFDAVIALATDPASVLDKSLRILALLEVAQNRSDKAAFAAAERLGGCDIDTDPSLSNAFGYVALLLGLDRDQAEKRIRYALTIRPRTSAFLDSLAWARYLAGDYAEAWKLMEEAIRFCDPQPEDCEMLGHAGAIRLALGDREGARRYCEKALKVAREGEKNPRRAPHIRPFVGPIRKLLEQMK